MKKCIFFLTFTLLTNMIDGAAGSELSRALEEDNTVKRFEKEYFGTLYPPIPALKIPESILNRRIGGVKYSQASSEKGKRDFFLAVFEEVLGSGTNRLLTLYMNTWQHTEIPAARIALAVAAFPTDTAYAQSLRSIDRKEDALPYEKGDHKVFAEKERIFLTDNIVPLLNVLLQAGILNTDRQFAVYKFEQQWFAAACDYEIWRQNYRRELRRAADPYMAATEIKLESRTGVERDEWIDMTEPEKKLADFYPEELKQLISRIREIESASAREGIGCGDWVEVAQEVVDNNVNVMNLSQVLDTYAEQAAQYRREQALKNRQLVAARMLQLTQEKQYVTRISTRSGRS